MQTSAHSYIGTPTLPFRVDRISIREEHGVFVMRDDLLPGGTKQRAVQPLLQDFLRNGIQHVTYASPFAGFAQVALAHGCKESGLRCTLFCERDPHQPGMNAHTFTTLAATWGAEIILVENLAEGEARAAELAEGGSCHKIPLGFHCREFQQHFQRVVRDGLRSIRLQLSFIPARIWLPVGSGTLTQAFHYASHDDLELHCVNVHVLPESDLRIQAIRSLPRVRYYSAKETFAEKATELPPLPSNIHYDAKLWPIIKEFSRNGDLWWNVAR
jgi:hypothetical protein